MTSHTTITKFLARTHGTLREWYMSLGPYKQLQWEQIGINEFVSQLYNEFIGPIESNRVKVREEYFQMKCYSFLNLDLEKHFTRMMDRFYILGGLDDVNMKQVFLNSFPEPLGKDAAKNLHIQGLQLHQITLGRLYQEIQIALQRLCDQQQFFKTWEKTTEKIKDTCDTSYLKIKCKDKNCTCPIKKHSHFFRIHRRKSAFHKHSRPSHKRPKSKKYRYFKRKKFHGKTSDTCYSYGKKGHFAKNCFDKKKKTNLMHMLAKFYTNDDMDADIESLYSIDEEFSPDLLFPVDVQLSETESGSKTKSNGFEPVYPLLHSNPSPSSPPLPL
ncbi:uncharacterized protein LOC122638833 [Telopea speciosissima]|uniref:uncharacterized protein LOC122638833 n=1 Tax=Telopea speciosissima TaxID=54955 RepID=UPI001CC6A81E|nr:uncharacterized protein LOC122638833 [Telopea speciosissima]